MRTIKIFLLNFILPITVFAQNFWEPTNGPYGGNVYSITISDSNYIYVGTSRGGLYKSTNNGEVWQQISNGIEYVQGDETILSISIDMNFIMYIATRFYQVYRSTDYGESWERKSNGLPQNLIRTTKVNKSNFVFAAASGDGIYRSLDQGENWTEINNGIGTLIVTDLAVNSNDLLFSSTIDGGIFRSSNNGDSWEPINNGLPILECNNIILVSDELIFTSLDYNSLFRSTDNGDSWHQVGNGLEGHPVLRIDNDLGGNLFAATFAGGVYKSSDLGENWIPMNNGIKYTATRTIEIDNNSIIYIGTFGGGVLKSENSGENWYETNTGIFNSYVRDFTITNAGILYTATSGGIFRTSDFGNEWEAVFDGLEDKEIRAIEANSNGKVFAGTWNEGLFFLDENSHWNQIEVLSKLSVRSRSIAIDENDWIYVGSYFGAGGIGIYRSTDDGETWTQVNSDINTLEIHSVKDGLIFAAGSGQTHSGLFKSTDYGNSWAFCAFEGYGISGITSDSLQNIYVITESPEGVYMSTDYGVIWNSIGLESSAKHSITTSGEGYLYVGTEWGVYRTSNQGTDWEPLVYGLTNYYASALICIPENKVFVGTLGGGVCIGPDSVTSVKTDIDQLPKIYYLSQNYPNPFNPVTKIKYSIPEDMRVGRQEVIFKVYDILGREVATLINEEKPAGEYEVEFDGSILPSGIYFYQLKSGDFISTRKMVLLK